MDRLKGTRSRIVDLLRRSALTANEIAARVGMTHNAVRGHLTWLLREGFVREAGLQRSVSRPAVTYEVTPEAEATLSKAYVPLVGHILRVLRERMGKEDLEGIMRAVGRRFASSWPRPAGDLPQRVEVAAALLEQYGAAVTVDKVGGTFLIRSNSCLLATAVQGAPQVCQAMETLLAEVLQAQVRECCERNGRSRCCFEIT